MLQAPFEPGPEHTRAFFEQRISDLVQSLLHCQNEHHLVRLKSYIAYVTRQWELTYAHTNQISQPDLMRLITLREERLTPLVRDLERRYTFGI